MHFQYRLTFKDYLAALALHAKRGVLSFLLNFAVLYVVPIWGLWMLASTLLNPHERLDPWSYLGPVYLLCCPALVLLCFKFKFKRSQMDSGECTLDFADVIIVQGRHSKTELEWSAIKSFREGRKAFLLYLAPGKFIPIPKRVCSEQGVIELRSLLQTRITPQTPALI